MSSPASEPTRQALQRSYISLASEAAQEGAEPARPRASVSERQGYVRAALGHQHGPRKQPRPGTSTWPLMVTRVMDIDTDPAAT